MDFPVYAFIRSRETLLVSAIEGNEANHHDL